MSRVNRPHRLTQSELSALLLATRQIPGDVGQVAAPLFWRALLLLAWDTGARTATLLRIESDWLDWQLGAVHIPGECQKLVGAKERIILLQAETLAALRMIFDSRRTHLFEVPQPVLYQQFRRLFGEIVGDAT